MSKTITNSTTFEPTPTMKVWLDTAVEMMTDSVTKISEKCKVSRQSWYEWQKSVEFRRWYQEEWEIRLSGFGWKLDVIGIKKAETDFRYWNAMQEKISKFVDRSLIDKSIEIRWVDDDVWNEET